MNSSQNNPFGSFSAGGNFDGGGSIGGGSGISGGDGRIGAGDGIGGSIGTGGVSQGISSGRDVMLTQEPEKGGSKKRVLVVTLSIVLVLVLGVGLAVVASTGMIGGGDSGFSALRNYIETGDAAKKDADTGDLIYAVSVLNDEQSVISEYYAKLAEKEKEFFDSLKMENEVFDKYRMGLRVLKNAIDYVEVREGLIAEYSSNGTEGARKYIDENIKCEGLDSDLATICETEMEFYDAALENHMIYDRVGCYIGGSYVIECAVKYYGADELFDRTAGLMSSSVEYRSKIATMEEGLSGGIIKLSDSVEEVLKNA